MGQLCTLFSEPNNQLKQVDKYVMSAPTESDIIISDPKLIIKKSTVANAGQGVFAGQFIPKNTIFCKSNMLDPNEESVGKYINDLLYKNSAADYSHVADTVTNIGYVIFDEETASLNFLSKNKLTCYLVALRNIMRDEELSRYYGQPYWTDHRNI